MTRAILALVSLLVPALSAGQENLSYQKPPQAIIDIADAAPTPPIVVSMRSPGFRKFSFDAPTPSGVPVKMRSPGSSVMWWLIKLTVSATPWIWFRVLVF